MTEFEQQVENYILADRQWLRQHRMAHAQMMMDKYRNATPDKPQSQYALNFWRAVLQRNED